MAKDSLLIADSDRSIFEEFDERQITQKQERQALTVPSRIARLTSEDTDDQTIMKMFGLTLRELSDIRKLLDYQDAFSDALADKVERPLEIDSTWDDIERKALRVAANGVEMMDADSALTMALRANKATRRTKDVVKDGSTSVNINTVNIAVPHAIMETLSEMNPSKEMQRMVDANAKNKIVDLARPQRIEDLMREKAREEQIDYDIKNAIG